jgi:4-nitrophenol 2-monooxygenase / 4-nitrocatechol 4-monooxygenase, reductase component
MPCPTLDVFVTPDECRRDSEKRGDAGRQLVTGSPDPAPAPPVDAARFREALGRFASGVTVVTTRLADRDFGATVSAFSSVSLVPPLVLCCLRRESETLRAVIERDRFVVCLLQQSQGEMARRFADPNPKLDRFDGILLTRSADGLPMIDGSLAQIVCNVVRQVQAGDHVVVFGSVETIRSAEGEPLVAFRGKFGAFYPVGRWAEELEDIQEWL